MKHARVDYDSVAARYHDRYRANPLPGVEAALLELVDGLASGVLEVGCGTGRWLEALKPEVGGMYGLDLSFGMLGQASIRVPGDHLVQGDAGRLPFPTGDLNVVFCVNALHHFDPPKTFLREAWRTLAPGGRLAAIGLDPRRADTRWYLYDYFPGTRETDLARYPSVEALERWMADVGFEAIMSRPVEHLKQTLQGREALGSPFLQKEGTSQLALLKLEAYQAGLQRLKADLRAAEAAGAVLQLEVDLHLMMTQGRAPGGQIPTL